MTDANNEQQMLEELIIANGINGSTGEYLTRMTGRQLLDTYILGEKPPADLDKLKEKEGRETEGHFGPTYGVDPKKLDSAGWGVIYPATLSPAVKEALSPLLKLRQEQAGALFKAYEYFGQSAADFLTEHEVSLAGAAVPAEMPYYILLVGSPEEISFNFQYELDVDRAVGRIYFDTVEEYDNYARSVVAAEKGEVRLPHRASFFGVANPGDRATQLSTDLLVEPLCRDFQAKLTAADRAFLWEVRPYLRDAAKRGQLERLLGGDAAETPAFLFTASHGMGFNPDDPRLLAHQGALLCGDWDGNTGRIPEEVYLAGEHIASTARLHGLIGFFFACYGAGVPSHDEFMQKVEGQPKQIAPRAFIAGLPRRLLSHPRGGALAIIGHVERAWSYSFKGGDTAHLGVFNATLSKLFDGFPVGDAFDYFNARHASASVQLVSLVEKKRRKIQTSDLKLIQTWSLNNDARDYIILGDPAVRLCVSEKTEEAIKPSALQLKPIDLSRYQPGATAPSQPSNEIIVPNPPPASREAVMAPAAEAESMALISPDQIEPIKAALKKLAQQLADTLNNLSTLEVLTYLSDDALENVYDYEHKKFNPQAKLKAVTLIKMDGDVQSMVPARQVESLSADNRLEVKAELDEQLLKIHREMVDLALANRTVFLKNLAEVAVTLLNVRL